MLVWFLNYDIGHHGHVIADRLMHGFIEHMDGFDLAAVDQLIELVHPPVSVVLGCCKLYMQGEVPSMGKRNS